MLVISIIVIVLAIISSFIIVSKGSIFTENVKGFCTIIHYILLIILIIISTIKYGWFNIIYMPILDIIVSQISSFIIITKLYKK